MTVGQDRAVEQFLAAWKRGALHHAWLLAGPRGVGKATFAREAATHVLAEAAGPPVDDPPPANATINTTAAMLMTHGQGPFQNDLFARGMGGATAIDLATALSIDALPKIPPTAGDVDVAGVFFASGRP